MHNQTLNKGYHRVSFALPLLVALGAALPVAADPRPKIRTGIDVLLTDQIGLVQGKRLGLVTNTSAVDSQGVTTLDRLRADPRVQLVQLYSPEHGLRLTGANGIGDASGVDPVTQIALEGLNSYRAPSRASLQRLDVLVFDIQDIGSRTFTYATTLGKALTAAGKAKIPVLVLDRPNPQGGLIFEGPLIAAAYRSVVGWGPVPVTHGMTLGELAQFFNAELGLHAKLTVVPMQGWRRNHVWEDTGLPWAMPATAVTRPHHAHLYAAAGMVGGASVKNADDGVCALHFFERMATTYADPDRMAAALNAAQLPGVHFEPVRYTGVHGPRTGRKYAGVHMVVKDAHVLRPLRTALAALVWLRQTYPKQFAITNRKHFLRIWGSAAVAAGLKAGWSQQRIEATWAKELKEFGKVRAKHLLYAE